ncbi:MAG: ATP-binding protein, partial [Pseudomonadota bacterium]
MSRANTDISPHKTFRGSRDALLSRAVDEPDLTWRVLLTLNAFRLLLAAMLLTIFFAYGEPRAFGERFPALFSASAAAYLVFAGVFAVALRQRWTDAPTQSIILMTVDIGAVTALMYTSGGVASGLGGLLAVFVGAGSLVLPIRLPAIMAAASTFAILGSEVFTGVTDGVTNYPAAGVLCAIIFTMAFAARPLAKRIQMSEALARQRGVDLKNLSELNEYIVQHLRESIVVVDSDNRVRLSNASAGRLLGAGGAVSDVPLSSVSSPLEGYLDRWRAEPSVSSHEEMTLVTAGNSARITAHVAPLAKDDNRQGPALIFLEDASHINARVQQSKLASLGRLSASIAHEIRNPVGAMSHAAQLLGESEALPDDDQRLIEIILSHSSRVSHIIDNVLQLSRRESSQPERLALKPWVEDFAQEFIRTLELQEGELDTRGVVDGLEVRMDRSHLRQVMWNLCDNAVKYASETGGILVEVKAGRLDGDGRPFLEVCDHGNGVDAATAEKIFEPFFTERSGGTGLGLYISRELCELNRAGLMYLDRPGGGSIFRIV